MSESTQVTAPAAPAELPDQAPKQIGKYEVRGEIGRGACGVVYRGFDPFCSRDVAIKVALHDSEMHQEGTATTQRSFFAEARAAGMLQHPHIVSTYDAGVEGELNYIVMEYIDGETLASVSRSKGPRLPIEQVIEIGFKCAKALDYAHSKGVLHRDIKPGNIMLTRDGVPKVMDFSIAEITANAKKDANADEGVMGSPLYMSPEQVRNQPLGPTSDLYAMGAVLYQLLTGEPVFKVMDVPTLFRHICNAPATRVDSIRADVPRPLCDIIDKLLLKDPAQRYQTGAELATALMRLFEQVKLAETQVSRRESRDSLRRLHFFSTFTDSEIDEILAASSMSTFEAGKVIIEEGAIDNAFYLMALGQAEVRKGGKRINMLDKGDCFGEIGFLTSAKRTASVVAATKVLALKVNSDLMEKVSRDCQLRFYKVFTDTLIYRLTVTSAKLSAAS